MNSKLDENTYSTSDLTLAVTLSLYFPVIDIKRISYKKAAFIFSTSKELEEHITKYWNSELLVEPKEYAAQVRNLRTRLYEVGGISND